MDFLENAIKMYKKIKYKKYILQINVIKEK